MISITLVLWVSCVCEQMEWEMDCGGVSKVMWHAEHHVSDVTLVEIWKTGGWKANDFLFVMKTSGHMIWNIWTVFLMFNVIMLWVLGYMLSCTRTPSIALSTICWTVQMSEFSSADHTESTHSVTAATVFGLYENVVLKIHFWMPCFPDLQNKDGNIFLEVYETNTHTLKSSDAWLFVLLNII